MKNLVHIFAILLTASLIGLASGIFWTIPLSAQTSEQEDILLPRGCAGTPFPMPPFMPGEFRGESNTTLVFDYERGGGFSPVLSFEKIFYNSLTKQLVSLAPLEPPEIKPITGPEQHCLEEVIGASGFFEAESDYPPSEGAADYFTYSLGIILGNRTHTVSWTDVSEGVPEGLFRIVDEIKDLAAN